MNPDAYTIAEHFVEVGDNHSLYVHDWGNKKATQPIFFLHGGPGAGINDKHRQRFDPLKQRVVFFDQRGSGKSLPKGSLSDNTTDHLVEDIEKVAIHLGIKQFYITGGSWGSCLAFAYALKHPKRVLGMVLGGIFTGTQQEIDYLDKGGFQLFFPDIWERFVGSVPHEHHKNPSAYHYKHALGPDPDAAKKSAYCYSELEGPLLSLDDRYAAPNYEEFDPDGMRIEMHYLANGCFMPDGHIFRNASKLTMPIWLVQGRYDMVCPPVTAYKLHKKLPNSQLIWTVAGHGNDRANYDVTRTILLQLTS